MKKIDKKGFTLIELMVVMAIIAVLAVLIIGAIQIARRTATETTNRSNAKTIQTGIEGYYAKNKQYPTQSAISFGDLDAVTTAGSVGASISLTTSCTGSTTSPVQELDGGGFVVSTATTYTIEVATYDCKDILANDTLSVN